MRGRRHGRRLSGRGTEALAGVVAIVLAAMTANVACRDPVRRYEVLTWFFDGVPPPAEAGPATATADAAKAAPASGASREQPSTQHKPFFERMCDRCHQMGISGKPDRVRAMCFQCHDKAVVPERPHDPVAEGACLGCHAPHDSRFPALLRKEPEEVCSECHDLGDEAFARQHAPLGAERRCTDCHSGHGGDAPAFLKPDVDAVGCRRCHATVAPADKAPIHGPVAAGMCNECHDTHKGRGKSLLRPRQGGPCEPCHDLEDLRSRGGHAGKDSAACLRCHEPHATGTPFMLRPADAPPKPAAAPAPVPVPVPVPEPEPAPAPAPVPLPVPAPVPEPLPSPSPPGGGP